MQNFQKYFSLLFFLAFSFGASAWGGFVTSIYKEPWYSTLIKPGFNPPDLYISYNLGNSLCIYGFCSLVNLDKP